MAIVIFPAESDVLLGHVVESDGGIPSFEGIAGIACEVRRIGGGGDGGFAVDGRNEDEIASWVVDLAATNGETKKIMVEPDTVVRHVADETLLRAALMIPIAAHSAAILTAEVTRECKGHLVELSLRVVVILNLDAVVRVDAAAALDKQVIFAKTIVVRNNVQPRLRSPLNLPPEARLVVC